MTLEVIRRILGQFSGVDTEQDISTKDGKDSKGEVKEGNFKYPFRLISSVFGLFSWQACFFVFQRRV